MPSIDWREDDERDRGNVNAFSSQEEDRDVDRTTYADNKETREQPETQKPGELPEKTVPGQGGGGPEQPSTSQPTTPAPRVPPRVPPPPIPPIPKTPPRPDPRFVPTQFNDPYTQQFEALLNAQLELLRLQQEEMRRAAEAARQRRAAAESAWGRFSDFANQRVTRLQGPAYTGTEQEVLRTQLLDPIERDRSAAHQRALEQISARGFEPDSGLAAELQRLVDQEFNSYRAGAQGSLAQRQIEEQRSREQEAQELLATLAQLPDALARGDLDFVNYVQGLIAAPGTQRIAIGDILSELPSRRLRDALAVLGVAPQGLSPVSNTNQQALQLLQLLQNQRFGQNSQWGNVFGNLGLSFQPR